MLQDSNDVGLFEFSVKDGVIRIGWGVIVGLFMILLILWVA